MRALALVLMLVASASLAQVTRGGGLKKRAYQTYGAVTLYVDPTGSDSGSCTASGTSACLTLAGALAKLPRFLRHAVAVNVAVGTYNEVFTVGGFDLPVGGTFAVTGTMSSFTPVTGTAAGTTTAATAGTSAGAATITDVAQTWTVDDLKGRFITFTSGALSGTSYPISTNTATTLTFPLAASAGVGVTYTIQTPGSVFTGGGTTPARIKDISGQGTVTISNIEVTRGGTGSNMSVSGTGWSLVLLLQTRIVAGATNSFGLQASGMTTQTSRSYIYSSPSAALTSNGSVLAGVGVPAAVVSNSVLESAANPALNITSNRFTSVVNSILLGAGPSTGVLYVDVGPQTLYVTASWLTCASSSIPGITIANDQGPGAGTFAAVRGSTFISYTGCSTAVTINQRGTYASVADVFNTVTTAYSVARGGHISLVSTAPTFTGVTNELMLDGTPYTYSFLNGLTPAVISNAYGSSISK